MGFEDEKDPAINPPDELEYTRYERDQALARAELAECERDALIYELHNHIHPSSFFAHEDVFSIVKARIKGGLPNRPWAQEIVPKWVEYLRKGGKVRDLEKGGYGL